MNQLKLLKRTIRHIFSYGTFLGLIPKPSFRPQGISAIMRIWNEKELVKASIESIKDVADEIIVVDTGSTDGTWEQLNEIKDKTPKLKLFRYPSKIPWEYSNFALAKTIYRWILKWDADFVAVTETKEELFALKSKIAKLSPNRYYYINPTLIELAGDFFHQFPGKRLRRDIEIFTYSEGVSYVPVERFRFSSPYQVRLPENFLPPFYHLKLEGLKIPLFYKTMLFAEPVGFHINIKSAKRHLMGYFWLQWLASQERDKFPTLELYVEQYVTKKWKFPDLVSAAKFYINEFSKNLAPYDRNLGSLPDNIQLLAEKSPYRVVYKNAHIIGRNDGK